MTRKRGSRPQGRELAGSPDLTGYDEIFLLSSSGKDSMAMAAAVCREAARVGVLDRVVMIHNDLGTTDTGEPIEWHGVAELAQEHAERLGIPFEVVTRVKGGLWEELFQRKKFPTPRGRYCTSDQKTSPGMQAVTAHVAKMVERDGPLGRPARILYCLGLRAQESPNRAKKPILAVDKTFSSGVRTITRWHPILHWSISDVWEEIKESGLRPHAAYSWGQTRLSCSLCPLASVPDLIRAVQRRPALAADYLRAEGILGHRFRIDMTMAELIELANRATEEGKSPVPPVGQISLFSDV